MPYSPEPARQSVKQLQPSLIRKLSNNALGRDGVIPLWFGEPDLPTPDFIRQAAKDALDAGDTFYLPNLGIPPLRSAIAAYMNGLYGTQFDAERIVVTASGSMALLLAGQCALAPGDTLVTPAPTWPNLASTQQILGANVARVPLRPQANGWQLDLERLFDACAHAQALLINSPGNPTGWMLSDAEQQTILDFCRRRGLWLIADEVYNRLVYDRPLAPSFADKVSDDDRVLIVNSFSKTWAMTGWRLGWITTPRRLTPTFEMLTEFNNSCILGPVQVAGIAALGGGEPFVQSSLARYRAARDLLLDRFAALPRIFCPTPQAAFYAFFSVAGMTGSYTFAEQALEEVRVGLAPGAAFGPEGEGFLRLCFAADTAVLAQALDRLAPMLA
jgi:aspartate/methionine/tyrosine aminotransferase